MQPLRPEEKKKILARIAQAQPAIDQYQRNLAERLLAHGRNTGGTAPPPAAAAPALPAPPPDTQLHRYLYGKDVQQKVSDEDEKFGTSEKPQPRKAKA